MQARGCYWDCIPKDHRKANRNGKRNTIYYPGGGKYLGRWLDNQHHGFGIKTNGQNVVYEGRWSHGNRQGWGKMRRIQPDASSKCIYIGQWRDDKKNGEGKEYEADGIYYGWWKDNKHSGPGIKWFNNGELYMGEWDSHVFHGTGVFFYKNGNRYEGHYARGLKNGEGTFYHMHTGQIQKGMWEQDICKTSIVQDDFRNQVEKPTEYPIPKNYLADPDRFMRKFFHQYINNVHRPIKSLEELRNLKFIKKKQELARLYPQFLTDPMYHPIKVEFPCTCKKREKLIVLHIR